MIDLSRYKDFLKSYSSLLVPIAIGLGGALLFVPGQIISSKLKAQIDKKSLSSARAVQSMRDVVPKQQWQVEQQYQQLHEKDVNEITKLARQTTLRKLLTYDLFPEPKGSSVFVFDDFGPRFCSALEKLIERVNAGECPTKAQLDEAKKGWGSRRSLLMGFNKVGATIEDELCRKKAQSICVYANPADFGCYNFWVNYKKAKSKEEALRDCWYSQLAYWIIEDVFTTIGRMNAGSENVFTSPVKRLLSVEFPTPRKSSRSSRYAKREAKTDNKPSYVLSIKEAPLPSFTGRVSNDDIDVVHFRISVILSCEEVLHFMQQLCSAKEHTFTGWDNSQPEQHFKHNQITILDYQVVPIDRQSQKHRLYRYGDNAIVQLNLSCEYIFDKKAYDPIKPQAVKDAVKEQLQEAQKSKRRPTRGSRRSRSSRGSLRR